MNNSNHTEKNDLEDTLIIHQQLSLLQPHNHKHLQHQIETLLQLEKYDEAELLLEKLYVLLQQQGLNEDAQDAERIREHFSQKKHRNRYYAAPFLSLATGSLMEKAFHQDNQVHVKEGEYLLRQGEHHQQMYMILEGELAVWSIDINGTKYFEHTLHDGEIVGEIAFLDGTPRTADVIACKDSTLLAIPHKEAIKLFLDDPRIESSLREEANTRRVQIEMKKNAALMHLPHHLQRIIAEEGAFVFKKAFERLYQSGQEIKSIDLICNGHLRLIGEDSEGSSLILNSMKTGSLIGCAALTSHMGNQYSADIVCVNNVTLVRFPLALFSTITGLNPRLYQALLKQAELERGSLLQTIHTETHI